MPGWPLDESSDQGRMKGLGTGQVTSRDQVTRQIIHARALPALTPFPPLLPNPILPAQLNERSDLDQGEALGQMAAHLMGHVACAGVFP